MKEAIQKAIQKRLDGTLKNYSKDTKVYLSDPKNKITDENTKIFDAYPKGHGLVEYYYGLKVKEYNGSKIFYFPDLDSHETSTEILKERIAKEIDGLEKESIKIWDVKKKEVSSASKTKDF